MSFLTTVQKFFAKLSTILILFKFCPPSVLYRSFTVLTGISELASPFVTVQGVFNIRRVGSFPSNTSYDKNVVTKPVLLYRSGDPSHITLAGKQKLLDLGVSTIFDMRAEVEGGVKTKSIPVSEKDPEAWKAVKRVPVPIADAQWAKDEEEVEGSNKETSKLEKLMKSFEMNEMEAFRKIYTNILDIGGDSYRTVFEFLRDHPEERALVHCTAGKDRTGLFVALFLMLLDVPDKDIVEDYALTTAGLEPILPVLIARFQNIKAYRDNWEGVQKMSSSRPETMQMALDLIREQYGGAKAYLVNKAGLSEEDVEKIRNNYLVQA